MTTHEIRLDRYCAQAEGVRGRLVLGTWNSYGIEALHLLLGDGWAGRTVTVVFHGPKTSAGTTVLAGDDGLVPVPQEATANAGYGTITIVGVDESSQRISVDIPYVVMSHAPVTGAQPDPTPDQWQQFVAQVKADADRAEQAAGDAATSADAAAKRAEAAAESAEKAEQASADIGEAKDAALEAIHQAQDNGVQAVEGETTAGVQAVQQAHQAALDDIATERETALEAVQTEGNKQQSAIAGAGAAALEAIGQVEQTAIGQVQQAGAAQVDSVNAAGNAQLDKINAANALVPAPTQEDAGKAIIVKSDGSGYELRSTLEKNISDYYAMRRTGKVYQTRLWKFASNPTSAGEKLLDNAGLVFEPSTDTEEGQDDYLNGQNPMFEWVNVNYVRDEDGAPRPTAIEGQASFKTSGSVDVGAMQMSFWFKIDSSNDEYIDYYVSDTPHPELGLVPWPECVKADGTVLPWCIGSKYISGKASDGLPRSQPGLKPIRANSYNGMINTYQQKGPGYWGAGAAHNTFQILFNAIKGATKSSQALYAGTTSYNFQYVSSAQRADAETWFPITNEQANNIVVGGYVSVGHGSNNNGAVNTDRGQSTVHAYADDVKVLRIEDLDENNKAVYLDIEEGFSTQPVALTDSLSAPIIMSSMHWWSGATDAVRGHHDGSPGSNTDGKHPYRVQGREYSVGGYVVASDTVAWPNEDGTWTIYTASRGTAHSKDTETIQSTYKQIGAIPLESGGTVANYWIGDAGIDEDTGAWYPASQGSGSTQGCGDKYYAGGATANTFREYLQCGPLWNGSSAGSCLLHLGNGLGDGAWYYLAGD